MTSIQFNAEQTQIAIDIPQMKRKSYETVKQFLDDLNWFHHNCRTIYPQERKIQAAVKRLFNYVNDQTEDIVACAECFGNARKFGSKSLVMTCSQPHLLLWALVEDYHCYWPAKVMAINVERGTAVVRFFSDYTKKTATNFYSYLYSKEHPKKMGGHRKPYEVAIQVSTIWFSTVTMMSEKIFYLFT